MYKITDNGVINLITKACIPNCPSNRHWQEYQIWLSQGNTPEPQYTSEELRIKHNANILSQIEELDKKRIRAICEPKEKDPVTKKSWLEHYNELIIELRNQLQN